MTSRKYRGALLAVGLTLTSTPVLANDLLDRLTLRESLDPKLVPKPALFHGIMNRNAEDTWDVSAGLRFNVAFGSISRYAEIAPAVEYQRNTALEKKQDLLKSGIVLEASFGDPTESMFVPVASSVVNYANDRSKGDSGFQAKTMLTATMPGCAFNAGCFWRPHVMSDLFLFDFVYGPYVGVEYDHTLKAADPAREGGVIRVAARGFVALYPGGRAVRHMVELLGDFTYRRDISGSQTDGAHAFLTTSANLYLYRDEDKKRAVGFGVDYVKGENPEMKFANQEFLRFTLKGMF